MPPVGPTTPSEASLRSDYVLGQDEYGSAVSVSLGVYDFPIPDLAVGRLVETAAEASGMLDAYLSGARRTASSPTPTTSLVTGYDFLRDDADSIKASLDAGTGHAGDALLADNNFGSPPTSAFTGAQMKTAVTGSRHDLIFMGGHFSANLALAADFATTMSSTDVAASAANLTNSIVFSAGCHAGYNLLDADGIDRRHPAARLGPGVRREAGDADRRHRLPVRRRRAHRLQRADLRRVRPPAPASAPARSPSATRSPKSKQVYLPRRRTSASSTPSPSSRRPSTGCRCSRGLPVGAACRRPRPLRRSTRRRGRPGRGARSRSRHDLHLDDADERRLAGLAARHVPLRPERHLPSTPGRPVLPLQVADVS